MTITSRGGAWRDDDRADREPGKGGSRPLHAGAFATAAQRRHRAEAPGGGGGGPPPPSKPHTAVSARAVSTRWQPASGATMGPSNKPLKTREEAAE